MISYFVRHPTAANLLMLIIILLGVMGAVSLTREVFPEFASDFIEIRIVYKGASAEEVEETICQRIEEELKGIEGIEEIQATSREGIGFVTVEVADNYDGRDVLDDVENAVDQIDNFPENIEEPLIFEVDNIDRVCSLTLWADNMPEKDLLALADSIENDLLAIDGISLVESSGFSEHQIKVLVREEDLLAQGLTIRDVAREIAAQSLDLPSGSVETEEREIKIRVVDQRRWANDFRDLTVKVTPDGALIPLRAVADVEDTFEEEWTQSTFIDYQEDNGRADRLAEANRGRRCVNLDVNKTESEDTIRVYNKVKQYIEAQQAALNPGVHLTLWGDWSFYVKDRLGMLVKNGILGFVLVFLTLWALLNIRISFWVAIGIPLSFLGTLFLLDMIGMSLNMITMFSLIMALGIIVDDAIVIGENIYAHYSRGTPPALAAVAGTKEVTLGVAASMLTTVAIFMPLLQMAGEIGKVMRVMPIGVITALTVSLIEAFFILPNHLGHAMAKIPKEPPRLRARINHWVEWFTQRVYGPVLDWSVRRPLIPLATVVMLLLFSLGMLLGGRLKFQLFPQLDGDFLVAQIEMPTGTDLRRTEQVVRRVEDALEKIDDHFRPSQPGQEHLVHYVSTTFGFLRQLGREPGKPESGSHLAQVVVELLSADQRTATCDEILSTWRREVGDVPDVVSLTLEQMQVTPGGKAIDIQLQGRNLEELQQASYALQERLRGTPTSAGYPGLRNVADNLRPGKQEVLVRLKPVARPLGITSAALADQLREAFWGDIAQQFQRGPDTFEVEVLLAPGNRRSLGDLDDFKVQTPDGRMVPFHEVGTTEMVRGFSQIIRVDGKRTVSVTADLDTSKGNAAEITNDLKTHFLPKLLADYPGVSINLEGQSKETEKTASSLQRGFLIGLAIIFILLSFVFQSYIEPLIVMLAIPFGLIGAVAGHLFMGIDWTMPSSIGFISLSGIIVNDSIVLVGFVKRRLREGNTVAQAVHQAGMQRFRPVFLTSATTVAGLLPMVLETSLQAQFLVPMAVSISFGLLFATVVILLMVPCMYTLLAWLGWAQTIEVVHEEDAKNSGTSG